MAKLTIVRGLPGSGKTTYSQKLGVFHVDYDMFSMVDGKYEWSMENRATAEKFAIEMVDRLLSMDRDIVVSTVFQKCSMFDALIDIACEHGAGIEVVRMMNDFGNIHTVPGSEMERLRNEFEDFDGETLVSEQYAVTANYLLTGEDKVLVKRGSTRVMVSVADLKSGDMIIGLTGESQIS